MIDTTFHVLLIEDNPGDAFLIQEMLAESERLHFQVETHARLAPGLARLDEGGIDVILLDLSLPDSHGLDTVRRTLQHPAAVPIVVLTGLDDQALGLTAVQEGAQDYLMKDEVSGRLLARAVRYAIERHRIDQERKELIADLEAFAHTVAHDLKAPLSPIIFAGDMLQMEYKELSAAEIAECGRTIVRNGQTMDSIIKELLLLASVHRDDVNVATVDMAVVFDRARERLAHLLEAREAEITTPTTWPAALGYSPWLEEVWVNYLSNAVKYGGNPPCVKVGATPRENGTVCFWIRDDGPGIPAGAQEQLFFPFTRLDQARATGHGLRLSIVRRIVEKLDGQVGVESTVGRGSTFTFTLPAP